MLHNVVAFSLLLALSLALPLEKPNEYEEPGLSEYETHPSYNNGSNLIDPRIEDDHDEPGMEPGMFPIGVYPESGLLPNLDQGPSPYFLGLGDWLGGAKNKPGETMWDVSEKKVYAAMNEIVKAASLAHDRTCSMGVANEGTHTLINPRVHLISGMTPAHPPSEIWSQYTGLMLFTKRNGKAAGTVGVITYDIQDTQLKLAIMWSVPFDRNLYSLWYNVKLYPKNFETGKEMFDQMYHYAGAWKVGGWETREEFGVKVRTSMTENIHSRLLVFVNTKDYDLEAGPERTTSCSYNAARASKFCWRECNLGGYCWTDKKCKASSECAGELLCSASCKGL